MGKIKLQSFTITLNKPDALYTLGEGVAGYCCIILNGEISLDQLEIKLVGVAETKFQEIHNDGESEHIKIHRGAHDILCEKYCPAKDNTETKIDNGEHRIPFNFTLPESGILNSHQSTNWNINYFVEGIIYDRKNIGTKVKHNAKAPIHISFPVYIEEEKLKIPLAMSDGKSVRGCFSSKSYNLMASIEHIGQSVGSVASVKCIAFNGSKSTINLKATLQQLTHLKAKKDKSRIIRTDISTVIGSRVKQGLTNTETLLIKIPKDLPILYDCPIIEMIYVIVVTLDVPKESELHVVLPVILTNQVLSFENNTRL